MTEWVGGERKRSSLWDWLQNTTSQRYNPHCTPIHINELVGGEEETHLLVGLASKHGRVVLLPDTWVRRSGCRGSVSGSLLRRQASSSWRGMTARAAGKATLKLSRPFNR
jgi:hypothetical protein